MAEANDKGKTAVVANKEVTQKDVVSMTVEQFEQLKNAIRDEYQKKIDKLEDRFDKLVMRIEQKGAEQDLNYLRSDPRGGPKIVVGPVMHGPPDHQKAVLEQAIKEGLVDPKMDATRFVNNHPDMRSLRRSEGYEPVILKDGSEARYMDGVLMKMPRARRVETHDKPVAARRAHRRSAIKAEFEQAADRLGFKTFGDGIRYDNPDKPNRTAQE